MEASAGESMVTSCATFALTVLKIIAGNRSVNVIYQFQSREILDLLNFIFLELVFTINACRNYYSGLKEIAL